MLVQDGLVPPLDQEEAEGIMIIKGSKQILKCYAKKSSLKVKDIKALIEDVFHSPHFNADDVDTDMLTQKQFTDSIDSGYLDIISMHQKGDLRNSSCLI